MLVPQFFFIICLLLSLFKYRAPHKYYLQILTHVSIYIWLDGQGKFRKKEY